MTQISAELMRIVDSAEANLRQVSEEDSRKPIIDGGWSRKQIIGHLVDSASNNHQRFVRAALQDSLDFPEYDQDGFVRVQFVQEAHWPTLVALWANYNRYLAHVISHLPASKLKVPCHIGSKEPSTLRFLVEDYMHHLIHHLGQVGVASPSRGGPTHR